MRLLLVANTLPPLDLSGVGEQVMQLATGLRQAGHEVEILGRGGSGARGPKLLFPVLVVPALLAALRRFRPDVVAVHESDGALAALATAVVRATLAAPPRLVALLQVSYVEEFRAVRSLRYAGQRLGSPGSVERRFRWLKAPLQIALGLLTVEVADLVMAPSAATARELERDYRARGVQVVPNATGGIEPPPATMPGAVADAQEYYLFVGRLRLRKGVEVLLHAIRGLPRSADGPDLLVAGDGEHRDALAATARELGLTARVRFLGRCSAGEVRALLERCRALVVPSIYEGMPLVVLEAMAAGRPVIASAVSGIPEVVVDGETGWLVPPEDPPALAQALAAAWADQVESARRGAAGRERVAREYTPAAAARRWLAAVGRRA